jgi:hypothetical protein
VCDRSAASLVFCRIEKLLRAGCYCRPGQAEQSLIPVDDWDRVHACYGCIYACLLRFMYSLSAPLMAQLLILVL